MPSKKPAKAAVLRSGARVPGTEGGYQKLKDTIAKERKTRAKMLQDKERIIKGLDLKITCLVKKREFCEGRLEKAKDVIKGLDQTVEHLQKERNAEKAKRVQAEENERKAKCALEAHKTKMWSIVDAKVKETLEVPQ